MTALGITAPATGVPAVLTADADGNMSWLPVADLPHPEPTGTSGEPGWVSDTLATVTLAMAYPLFCKDVAGTYWRVDADANGLVPVALAGITGHADHSADDQPGIQQAILYAEAIGAAGTRYDHPAYSLWRKPRNQTAPNDIHADKSGLLLQTGKSHRFVSTCDQSVFYRRDLDGSAMGIAKFSNCTGSGGYKWRGGCIFTEGQTTAPASPAENSIHLHNIMLDGGITDSSEENNPYGAFMHSSGDGWDASDKAIWQSNDRYCGNITLTGNSGARYFMGELIYGSGVGASTADRKISIGPDVTLGHTCGSCLNGNGQTLEVERCHLHNGFIGIEGWTGHLGGYFKARISNCNRNTFQGGIPNFVPGGNYFIKARPSAVMPIGQIDVVLYKAGKFDIGSWVEGKITAIDCYPSLGDGAAFPGGSQDVRLSITTIADTTDILGGVGIYGGAAGTMTTDRVFIDLECKRTDIAAANNKKVAQAVYSYGSFGPSVVVRLGALEGTYKPPAFPAGTITDNPITITGLRFDIGLYPPWTHDIEANNGGTVNIKGHGNVIALSCTHNGGYAMNLPAAPAGYRLFVVNMTNNYVSGGATCVIPAGNFRGGAGDLTLMPGYGHCELEYDGQKWAVITAPPR